MAKNTGDIQEVGFILVSFLCERKGSMTVKWYGAEYGAKTTRKKVKGIKIKQIYLMCR